MLRQGTAQQGPGSLAKRERSEHKSVKCRSLRDRNHCRNDGLSAVHDAGAANPGNHARHDESVGGTRLRRDDRAGKEDGHHDIEEELHTEELE